MHAALLTPAALHNVDCDYTLADPLLTARGLKQAAALPKSRPDVVDAVDLVVSSPLKRCIATAHRAFEAAFDRGVPLLLLSELQEVRAHCAVCLYSVGFRRSELWS